MYLNVWNMRNFAIEHAIYYFPLEEWLGYFGVMLKQINYIYSHDWAIELNLGGIEIPLSYYIKFNSLKLYDISLHTEEVHLLFHFPGTYSILFDRQFFIDLDERLTCFPCSL